MSKGGLIWYTWVVNRWSCGWRMMWMIEVLQPVSIQVVPALDTVFFRMRVFMWNFSVSRQRPAKICVEFVVLKIPEEFIVEFWIHQVCVSCAGRSGCRICEVLYTRTSTFFCLKELFAFLVLRHFGIDGCHGTTRFSFAWLRVIEYGHLIVRSEEGCRTIFCLFLWVGWGHCRSHHASVRICSTGMASLSSIDSSWFLMLSLLLPSLLIFRIGGVVSPVHS